MSAGRRPRGRGRVSARLAALALGLVASLVLVELALQLGAWVVRATRDDSATAFATGGLRVLCVGDSNTYGLYVERDEAYPQQLERVFNERFADALGPIEVVNLGVPGTNSSVLRRSFGGLLDALRPDVAIVLVGVNDYWTTPVEFQTDDRRAGAVARFLDRHSRLFKLAYMVLRGARNDASAEVVLDPERVEKVVSRDEIRIGDQAFEMGFERSERPRDGGEVAAELARNLAAIVATARDHGVAPILLTYASEGALYGTANALLAAAADETGTPLVELRPALAARCPEDGCRTLYFPDRHPRPEAYRMIATAVAERLAREMRTENAE